MKYDLVIVGGGPGGVAAGVYAARKKMKTVLVTDIFGGQSLVSAEVQNWIGTKSVSGFDLGKMLEEHLRAQEDIDIIESDTVAKVEKISDGFRLTTLDNKTLETRTLLITSGSRYRKLGVPGEKEFEGKGVAYCSTCDAPIFKGKDVAVIGGGNSGLEAVIDLFPYATKIYLIHRSEALKGDPVTQEKVRSDKRVQVILNSNIQEIIGNGTVQALRYKDNISGEMKELKVQGVFVKIGLVPNSDIVKNIVELSKWGEIVIDHKTQKSSAEGIWAAGDVTDVLYRQNNISAGDAVKAVLSIYDYLQKSNR